MLAEEAEKTQEKINKYRCNFLKNILRCKKLKSVLIRQKLL